MVNQHQENLSQSHSRRFFADIISDVIREGSFSNLQELEKVIENYLSEKK